ncbi:Crp/Fnr family transcriptional regulator [Dyadobacter chenwenxiniae]|uniref:Crp/Fnr family transcriptional regulator n=1 Tax=Dyadobacter chenwenxiniae TaxID=2906456 RepID=A0A9X1PSD0_9BACT|nr:Crp/Fnr family transcriptional regulator [Dyadobacter chenwenxiniae]MCF0065600.1 Crp/Fnr family transcriptional regulator [Dyadobacter chenwenxiniae]UON85511.1 Crp/Fnr family transcriptional regulator [Dyadobacter chenwenxiniae]
MHSKKSNQVLHEQEMSESIEAIKKFIGAVAPMGEEDLELLPSILEYKKVKKNDYILKEGEICKNVYFLTKGFLRMFFVDHSGNEVNYRFTFENDFFVDFQSFLLQKPSHFFWQAMQDSEFLVLPKTEILKLYATSPAWNNFGRLVSEKVYLQMNERVEMLLFMTPEERYNHLLSTQPELFAMVSQFHLSSYLGVKPESLSRLRKRLLKK